jgi:hypothetical protein
MSPEEVAAYMADAPARRSAATKKGNDKKGPARRSAAAKKGQGQDGPRPPQGRCQKGQQQDGPRPPPRARRRRYPSFSLERLYSWHPDFRSNRKRSKSKCVAFGFYACTQSVIITPL